MKHSTFLIPIMDKWLLHAPLHKISALLNENAAQTLQANSYPTENAQLNELLTYLKSAQVDYPKPLEGDICCLLYTSPSPRDRTRSRMPSSA